MKIYIKYNNKKKIINTKNYQSINSIIYHYLEIYNIDDNIENYYLDYNGKYLDGNNCLEKYELTDKSIVLTLNIKQKGGNSFFTFAKANPVLVIISFMISLAPILILPSGFVPSTASLIKTIIEQSIGDIGKYLVCTLGKITLYSRIKFFLDIMKYTIFIIMIYVIVAFPLILFCITLKGNSVLSSPQNMCSPVKIGSLVGLILTSIYVMIYVGFRFGDYVIQFVINLFKKVYFLNTTFNPTLLSILRDYNKIKYIPYYCIPMIGTLSKAYFMFLNVFVKGLRMVLSTVSDIGCKSKFDQAAFMDLMSQRIKDFNDKTGKEKEHAVAIKTFKRVDDNLCELDFNKCCNPDNFLSIGNVVMDLLNNGIISNIIKEKGLFPSFVLFNQALYEYGISNEDISNNIPLNLNDRERFLKNILTMHKTRLSDSTKYVINEYLNTYNPNLLSKIKEGIDTDFSGNITTINEIKMKLNMLDIMMKDYSIQDGSSYVMGGSLVKTILKTFILNSFCNVLETTKTGTNIMDKMGDIIDITDMLKAGAASGIIVGIGYIVSIIVLLIMCILNKF